MQSSFPYLKFLANGADSVRYLPAVCVSPS